jgi:enterochelin esterase-like enzyme
MARRSPLVAGTLAVAILGVAALTGTLWHDLPPGVAGWGSFGWPALVAGRWWTAGTSLFLTRNPFMAVTMSVAVAAVLGAYERRAGPWRSLAVAGIGHLTGSVVTALGVGTLGRTWWPVGVRAAQNLDYGASMVVAAALGALASRAGDRRIVRLVGVGAVLALVLHHQLSDWAHLLAIFAGYVSDRARRPRRALAQLALTGIITAWLAVDGAQVVIQEADAVRFAPASTASAAALPLTATRPVTPAPRGKVVRLDYRSPALGQRTMVAWVYVPPAAASGRAGRLPVALFLHSVPGAPDDWLAGGNLPAQLDRALAAGSIAPMLAVIPDGAGTRSPMAGWRDVRRQHLLTSVRRDLLAAVAARFPAADLGPGRVAVIGVGGGAEGAARLSRFDPRVGYVAAIDPPTTLWPAPGVHLLVVPGQPARRSGASRTWARWRVEIAPALQWLTDHGFGAGTSA